jgi:ABC-2 type transport system ATP-binding protein
MEEAEFLADRIGIIDEGRIVALGTPQQLKTEKLDTHTMIIKAWNLTQKVVADIKKRYAQVEVDKGRMIVTDKQISFEKIVDQLHANGALVRSAYFKEPTLEDVFLKVTGKELRE